MEQKAAIADTGKHLSKNVHKTKSS